MENNPLSDEYLEFIRNIINGSDEAIGCFDLNYRYILFNLKHFRETQKSYHKNLETGMSLHELLADAPADYATIKGLWERTLKGEDFNFISSFGTPTQRKFHVRYYPLYYKGKIIAGIHYARDISYEIEVEEAHEKKNLLEDLLHINKELIRRIEIEKGQNDAIIKQIPAAVIFGEAPSGKLIYANSKMESILGFSQIQTQNISEYDLWVGYHPDGRRYLAEEWPLARSIMKGEVVDQEDVEMDRKGERSYLRLSSAPIRDSEGTIIAGVVICQDITELVNAIKARDEFVSFASHELKTPLTALKLQSQIMRKGIAKKESVITDEMILKLVDQIDKQTTRLNNIVDDMLDISRVTTGKMRLNLTEFDLYELAKDVVCKMSNLPGGDKLSLKNCQKTKGIWDMDRMEQVFINLLSNALKYGLEKPVSIEISQENDTAILTVMDQGIGIDKKFQTLIFEKFQRGNIQDNNIAGLGIGLYITKEIVHAHKGSIRVISNPGQGSTFEVLLPLKA